VFLHEVVPGTADRSYGIHVAQLAGLPKIAVVRAKEVLKALEDGREGHKPLARIDDLPLFAERVADRAAAPEPARDALREAIAAANPDALSPKEALEMIYVLKRLVAEGEKP
jgi:DNA mismatch repair protein MutS